MNTKQHKAIQAELLKTLVESQSSTDDSDNAMNDLRVDLTETLLSIDESWGDRFSELVKAIDSIKNQKPPVINVEASKVEPKLSAPTVNVSPTPVNFTPNITVPQSSVTVEAPKNDYPKAWKFDIERDSEGFIKGMTAKVSK